MAAGVAQSNADNWVQPVTVTLTGHESGTPPGGAKINNKVILEALSGATVTNFVGGGSSTTSTTNTVIAIATNSPDINVTNDATLALSTNNFTLTGTNGIFGTNGTLVFSNFPTSLTATGVTFQTQSGTNIATNVTVTLTLDTNAAVPTYTFDNIETNSVGTNGYAFTNSFALASGTNPAPFISAILQTNSTTNELIFSLESSYSSNIVTTVTNVGSNVVVTLPATPKGASLVLVTALPPGAAPLLGAGSTNAPLFAIKSGSGKNVTLTDISAFFTFLPATGSNHVTAITGTVSFGLVGITFNCASGGLGPISLGAEAFYKETDVNNKKAGAIVPTSITTTAIGEGAFDATVNNVVFSGTVNAGAGSVSTAVLTEP
jgi:hypothetical protein